MIRMVRNACSILAKNISNATFTKFRYNVSNRYYHTWRAKWTKLFFHITISFTYVPDLSVNVLPTAPERQVLSHERQLTYNPNGTPAPSDHLKTTPQKVCARLPNSQPPGPRKTAVAVVTFSLVCDHMVSSLDWPTDSGGTTQTPCGLCVPN